VNQISIGIQNTRPTPSSHVYDNLDRLTTLTQSSPPEFGTASQVVPKRVEFAYNAAGQFTAIDRYNEYNGVEVVAGTLIVGTTYTYDLAGRLTEMVNTPDVAAAVTQSWTFDDANRITSYTNSVDSTITYGYDNTDQLTSDSTPSGFGYDYTHTYSYDAAGNRTGYQSTTYTIGAANRLEEDEEYVYTYDNEGNRISKNAIFGGDSTTYEWDHRNRLVAVHFDTSGNHWSDTFEYDVFNRRTSRTHDPQGTTLEQSPQIYIYDGDNVAIDFIDFDGDPQTASFEVARKYLYGPAVDQLLAQEDMPEPMYAADRVMWVLHDHQNTTRDIVNNAGQLHAHNTYDVFGYPAATSDLWHVRYGYTGREFDAYVHLQYNRNRWYDGLAGRWLSEDPIPFIDGSNNYTYVHNSPTNFTDPSGLVKRVTLKSTISPTVPLKYEVHWTFMLDKTYPYDVALIQGVKVKLTIKQGGETFSGNTSYKERVRIVPKNTPVGQFVLQGTAFDLFSFTGVSMGACDEGKVTQTGTIRAFKVDMQLLNFIKGWQANSFFNFNGNIPPDVKFGSGSFPATDGYGFPPSQLVEEADVGTVTVKWDGKTNKGTVAP
jgi:RHS repeat-associated protein